MNLERLDLDLDSIPLVEKEESFLKIQNSLMKELSKETRLLYQTKIQKISDLSQKIRFILDFEKDILLRKNPIQEYLEKIEKEFPNSFNSVKEELNKQFENEKFFFLQKKFLELKKIQDLKKEEELFEIQLRLMERMNPDEYESLFNEREGIEELSKYESLILKYKKKYLD